MLLVVVGTLFGSVLASPALGSAVSAEPAADSALADQYTGCLTPLGKLRRVAIGTEPARECTAAQVEITWSEEGPAGPQGDRGRRGRRGIPGQEGPPGVVPAATDATGAGQAVDNMSPHLAVSCIIATTGVYPSRNDSPVSTDQAQEVRGAEPFLGEISWFAGNFAPRGWAFCDASTSRRASPKRGFHDQTPHMLSDHAPRQESAQSTDISCCSPLTLRVVAQWANQSVLRARRITLHNVDYGT